MPFKLIIVEDEKIMREGFANFVDWKSMDFEVAAKLEDGRDAIDYIGRHPVDVVLTDIKMTFVSGIELAKYIYENKLPIKVVLVSGFKEFEYARQAMRYNVDHFLLKPAPVKEIESMFAEIRQQLEKEMQERQIEQEKDERYLEVIKLLQEQFFFDIVLGTTKNTDEIRKRICLLNLKIDVDKSKCSIVNITIKEFENFSNSNWKYGKDGLYTAVRNFIHSGDGIITFYPIGNKEGNLKFLAISQEQMHAEQFKDAIDRRITSAKEGIKNFLGLEIAFHIEKSFDNIFEFAADSASPAAGGKTALPDANAKASGASVIQCAKEYIRDRYNRDITLDEIAEHVFLNPIYLSRLFKEQTGENYIDYLIKVRMEKAIELLQEKKYKVYEIGSMVGYDSIKYFYKVFKRVTGQTPTEYRESLWGSEFSESDIQPVKEVSGHDKE